MYRSNHKDQASPLGLLGAEGLEASLIDRRACPTRDQSEGKVPLPFALCVRPEARGSKIVRFRKEYQVCVRMAAGAQPAHSLVNCVVLHDLHVRG